MNPWNITDREKEVMAALVSEGTAKHAARKLGISFYTVEWHMKVIKAKMNTRHALTAVVTWERHLNSVVGKQGMAQ